MIEEELRRLSAEATAVPWEYDDTSDQTEEYTDTPTGWFRGDVGAIDVGDYSTLSLADAALIVALRNRADALADVVAALRGMADKSNCHCEVDWLARGRHAPDCFWDFVDSFGGTDVLATLDDIQ